MYGSIKAEYLSQISDKTTLPHTKSAFHKIEPAENRIGKDICNMEYEELYECLKALCSAKNSKSSIKLAIYCLSDYIEYCIKRQYAKVNLLKLEPANVIIEKVGMSGKKYYSPHAFEELCRRIRAVPNGLVYETFLRCVYEGVEDMEYENLAELTTDNLMDSRVYIKNGKCIAVTTHLQRLLHECAKVTILENPTKVTVLVNAPHEHSVFKSPTFKVRHTRKFTKYASEIKGVADADIGDIRDSGIFNRIRAPAGKAIISKKILWSMALCLPKGIIRLSVTDSYC